MAIATGVVVLITGWRRRDRQETTQMMVQVFRVLIAMLAVIGVGQVFVVLWLIAATELKRSAQ